MQSLVCGARPHPAPFIRVVALESTSDDSICQHPMPVWEDQLLEQHRQHLGAYARVAREINSVPAHVSQVASGKRRSKRVMATLIAELRRIESLVPESALQSEPT